MEMNELKAHIDWQLDMCSWKIILKIVSLLDCMVCFHLII